MEKPLINKIAEKFRAKDYLNNSDFCEIVEQQDRLAWDYATGYNWQMMPKALPGKWLPSSYENTAAYRIQRIGSIIKTEIMFEMLFSSEMSTESGKKFLKHSLQMTLLEDPYGDLEKLTAKASVMLERAIEAVDYEVSSSGLPYDSAEMVVWKGKWSHFEFCRKMKSKLLNTHESIRRIY